MAANDNNNTDSSRAEVPVQPSNSTLTAEPLRRSGSWQWPKFGSSKSSTVSLDESMSPQPSTAADAGAAAQAGELQACTPQGSW